MDSTGRFAKDLLPALRRAYFTTEFTELTKYDQCLSSFGGHTAYVEKSLNEIASFANYFGFVCALPDVWFRHYQWLMIIGIWRVGQRVVDFRRSAAGGFGISRQKQQPNNDSRKCHAVLWLSRRFSSSEFDVWNAIWWTVSIKGCARHWRSLSNGPWRPGYVAPEILQGTAYDQRADMWSVRVILYILLGGYSPFIESTQRDLLWKIRKTDYEFHEEYWGTVSRDAKDLISSLLTVDSNVRLTATQAMENP